MTGRYQLLYGPWYHLTATGSFAGRDLYALQLAWFDRWLKNEPTGIDRTRTPLHLYELGADRWTNSARWPTPGARPTTLYLGGRGGSGAPSVNDGSLTAARPTSGTAADRTFYSGLSNPCNASLEQWGAGAGALALETAHLPSDPCTTDDRAFEATPGALTYTTAPLRAPAQLAGPVDATIYATSTRPEVELVATLEDVAPDGQAVPLTSGALLGSLRQVDPRLSWYGSDGRPLLPYHPYTQRSSSAVPVGKAVRYDIEIFPSDAQIPAGYRLRLTLTTSDIPHLLASPAQARALAGGVYEIDRSENHPSYLEVPLVGAGGFPLQSGSG